MSVDQFAAAPPAAWTDVIAALVRRGAHYFGTHRAARQLLISPKTPPELKLRDRQSDAQIGKLFEQQVESRFVLPEHPERSAIFFRAVEIADLMFSLSMLEHGAITDDMTEEAVRAVVGYLLAHFPAALPRRGREIDIRGYLEASAGVNLPLRRLPLTKKSPLQTQAPCTLAHKNRMANVKGLVLGSVGKT